MDLENCYGYFQATYTSDSGMTNISHLPIDYLVDFAGNLDTVGCSNQPALHTVALHCQDAWLNMYGAACSTASSPNCDHCCSHGTAVFTSAMSHSC